MFVNTRYPIIIKEEVHFLQRNGIKRHPRFHWQNKGTSTFLIRTLKETSFTVIRKETSIIGTIVSYMHTKRQFYSSVVYLRKFNYVKIANHPV